MSCLSRQKEREGGKERQSKRERGRKRGKDRKERVRESMCQPEECYVNGSLIKS